MRLAAAGALLAEDLGFELVPELWSPAARATFDSRTEHVLIGHTGAVNVTAISPDGKRVVTGSYDNTARLWDASTGAEIAVLKAHTRAINAASFSPDGKRVVTGSDDNTAKILDVSRSELIGQARATLLTAALARNIGLRTTPEAQDLLMRTLPGDDLFAQALAQLGRTADDPELQAIIAGLHAPKHANCYLSPTQFAEKFGLEQPRAQSADAADEEQDPVDDDLTDGIDMAARVARAPVSADDLAGQEYVETHYGVAIFRLTDGRYHVVSNFAVATLEEARVAAAEVSGAGGVA